MHWSTWTIFAVTELTLCLTPGPAVMLVLSQALIRGAKRSLWSSFGILAGNLFYFCISATSLSALLAASHRMFLVIKWLGAAYLVWTGIQAFTGRSAAFSAQAAEPAPVSGGRLMLNGFVLQVANPKAILFATALLPQFISPSAPVAGQVAILAATSFVMELAVLAAYGHLAGRAAALAARPRYAALTDRLAGSMLVAAGIGMASLKGA